MSRFANCPSCHRQPYESGWCPECRILQGPTEGYVAPPATDVVQKPTKAPKPRKPRKAKAAP